MNDNYIKDDEIFYKDNDGSKISLNVIGGSYSRDDIIKMCNDNEIYDPIKYVEIFESMTNFSSSIKIKMSSMLDKNDDKDKNNNDLVGIVDKENNSHIHYEETYSWIDIKTNKVLIDYIKSFDE